MVVVVMMMVVDGTHQTPLVETALMVTGLGRRPSAWGGGNEIEEDCQYLSCLSCDMSVDVSRTRSGSREHSLTIRVGRESRGKLIIGG